MSRLFAIGDVHGYLKPLEILISNIAPQPDDTLIFLGDVIDHGEDSKGVIDLIIDLQTQCTVKCIQGNHEEMLLNSLLSSNIRDRWLLHGGQETLQSFGLSADKIGLAKLPEKYIQFFRDMLPYVETEKFIFTHATPVMHLPMDEQTSEGLRWNSMYPSANNVHESGKMVICGHTPQYCGTPWADQKIIAIDTYICGDKWLTALDMDNLVAHQAGRSSGYQSVQLPKITLTPL